MHGNKVVHGNLKPSNILFDQDNKTVKISDLRNNQLASLIDKCQNISFDYSHLAPEELECKHGNAKTYKTDIWALGVLLYQLCALQLPFQSESVAECFRKILHGEVPPIPKFYS